MIGWARDASRVYLEHHLEVGLLAYYSQTGHHYKQALELGSDLLKKLKKIDDKPLLVKVSSTLKL